MTTPQVRRTSFLDTGALAKLYALWETCDQVGFRLDLVNTWKDVRDAVQRAGGPLASQYVGKDFTDIKSGLSLFTRMKEARADCDFFSCRAAYAELHRLVLVEMAIEKLTLQRVPRTIRNKRPLAIYQDALATTDFNQVNDDLDNFFEEMRINQRIDIKLLESNGGHGILPDPNKILDVAMVLWSHLMIETLDAYMYASAIICEANYFLTTDSTLRDMAKGLSDQTGDFRVVAQKLRADLGLPNRVRLPRGAGLNQALHR